MLNRADHPRDIFFQLMLPDSNNSPSERAQLLRRLSVALLVPLDLVRPEAAIGSGLDPMFGAAVPKTAINEGRYLRGDKDNVRRAWQIAPMQSEPESLCMQG